MSIGAPDPKSFQGMMDAFAMVSPAAAVEIVLPAFTFGPSCTQIARIIYMNQCNPGQIMTVGAYRLQLVEKYIKAGQGLDDEVPAMDSETWEGEDCDAFVDQSGKASMQLCTIAATGLCNGLAAFIGCGMTGSWAVLATQGNVVNPFDMVGPDRVQHDERLRAAGAAQCRRAFERAPVEGGR